MALAQDRGVAGTQSATGTMESRIALVIGNAAYDNAPLANPVNDATDMADQSCKEQDLDNEHVASEQVVAKTKTECERLDRFVR